MRKIIITIGIIICITIECCSLFAQEKVEMADVMRDNGKIYVVVAVLSVVFLGIIIFLISLDRKVKKLEEDINKK